jgi:ubiquinone/menaquinone biosynthesis C-methylase UbiE
MTSLRNWIKQKLPEAIPAPGAIMYNALVMRVLKKPESEIVKEVVKRIKSGTVVDLGSGTGYLAIEIARMLPDLEVVGIDLSREMIKISEQHSKGVNNVRFELHNANSLPFTDDSVDLIVSTGSMHHWKKPIEIFNECYRVLKSNHGAWIYDGCSNLPKEHLGKMAKEYRKFKYMIIKQAQKLHGFTWEEYHNEIRELLEESKFKNSYQIEPIGIWMKITLNKSGSDWI